MVNNFLGGGNAPHPLEQWPILKNVFKHLKSDTHTLKTCRLISKKWNTSIDLADCQLPIRVSRNINELNQLMSNSNAQLFCRFLVLSGSAKATGLDTIRFLENYGQEIRKLIVLSKLNLYTALLLPQLCHNLTYLDITPRNLSISILEIPLMFKKAWKNPFPQLQHLVFRLASKDMEEDDYFGIYDDEDFRSITPQRPNYILNVSNFIILILRKAVKLTILTLVRFQIRIWNQLATEIAKRRCISERLSKIELNLYQDTQCTAEDLRSLWIHPELKLRILVVQQLPGVRTTMFSTVLKNLSRTLEELHWKDPSPLNDDWLQAGYQLHFPCIMTGLRTLSIKSYGRIQITCSGPSSNVFEKLPNLEIFHQGLESERKPRRGAEFCNTTFWNGLFPTESIPNSEYVHNTLQEFTAILTIPVDKVKELSRMFPQLQKCSLRVKGKVMEEVVTKLVNCKIEELNVLYYETSNGFDEFVSAISGIRSADCDGDKYKKLIQKGQVYQIRKSLGDWPHLKILQVFYQAAPQYDSFHVTMTRVCLERGFRTIKNLKKLDLSYFEIHPVQIRMLLSSASLKVFNLGSCEINFWDDSTKNVPTELSSIREDFPNAQLIID